MTLDSPFHFLSPSNKRDGPTKAKERLIEDVGWQIINMSYIEFAKYKKENDDSKKTMLAQMLIPLGALGTPVASGW